MLLFFICRRLTLAEQKAAANNCSQCQKLRKGNDGCNGLWDQPKVWCRSIMARKQVWKMRQKIVCVHYFDKLSDLHRITRLKSLPVYRHLNASPIRSRCVPNVFQMRPLCFLYASSMRSQCVPDASLMRPWCVPDAFPMLTWCVLNAFLMRPRCLPDASPMLSWCVPDAFLIRPRCIPNTFPRRPQCVPTW